MNEWSEHLPQLCDIARQAGRAIMNVYQHNQVEVTYKSDNSPVTQADLDAHQIIKKGLTGLIANATIVSEEEVSEVEEARLQSSLIWLVDPLDGTKEFIGRTGEFSVNIALVENGAPVLGVIYAPVSDDLYFASIPGEAYWQQGEQKPVPIHTQPHFTDTWRITVSRRHSSERLKEILADLEDYKVISCGSALKLCLIAKGDADIYPRLGNTSEWDTAAGHCILKAAGGLLINLEGEELQYNKQITLLNSPFLALSSAKFLEQIPLPRLKNLVKK